MRVAVALLGAQIPALPTPSRVIGSRSSQVAESGVITAASQKSELIRQTKPMLVISRGWIRSVSRPTQGASTIDITAIGTRSSADLVGERPRTSWAYSMSGKAREVIAKPIVVITTLASEKLRSRNRNSGTSGSALLRACQKMKSANTTRPAMIRLQTVIGPVMVPQSYWWPSWMPNTSRNMPVPLSATPSQSNRWVWVGSVGTSRQARTKPTMPTGTLTKKIHSQPRASTSSPPAIGPTSAATPAVAPHRAIARPRLAAGKIRVITAIVCGVIIDAPSPCTTRARISISMLPVSPHQSEAIVKRVSPER